MQVQAHQVESVALHLLVLGVMGAVQALCQGVDHALEQRLQVFCACTHFHCGDGSCQGKLQEARGSAAWSLLTIFADACLRFFRDCFASALKVGSRDQRHSQDARGALNFLVHAVTEALQYMCQGRDRNLEQRLEVFRAISLCSFLGGEPGSEISAAEFGDFSGGEWRKPKRFAKQQAHCQQQFALSGPQFFSLDAADAEVEHMSVSGEAVAGDGKEVWGSEGDLQACEGIFVAGTFGLGSSSPRGDRSVPTRSEMPCAPGQSKGCKQGSKERVEDQSSQEAPQARDSVQRVEAAGARQQVQSEDFEQRGEHVPGAEEVLVATQEEVVPQFSPEVVIVEASPDDKPRGDGARGQEARQLCASIGALLLPLKPGVVPTEVERKLVVLIERLEQVAPEHSPLWELGFSVCEALSDPWHALEAAQGLCANLIAEPSLHAELHDGVGLQQPVDGSSGEPTLPIPCCQQEQPQGGKLTEVSQVTLKTRVPGSMTCTAEGNRDESTTETKCMMNGPKPWCQQASAGKRGQDFEGSARVQRLHSAVGLASTQDLVIGFANVTSCNPSVITWLESCGCAMVGLQETHLSPATLHDRRGTVEALQWKLIGQEAFLRETGSRIGGVAWVARKHRNVWTKHSFLLEGAGYEAIGVQAQGLTYTMISLYLKDTEGPTGPRNTQILASLVAYVRELPEPWIIGGDWNCTPHVFMQCSVCQVMRGRLITAGEITCTQGEGNELDFVLVSRCIEAAVTLTVDWQVPWKPHAALKLIVAGAGVADPRWRLQQFAKLTGDVSERDWPEVGAVTPHIMGQVGHDEVSNALGRWAKAMEVCRGDPQGRGYQVDKVWGTVRETRVVQASKTTAAGWWSRMRRCIITLQSQLSRNAWDQVQGNADAADVILQREVSRPEEASFVAEVAKAFEQRQVKALGKLREAAEANEAEAQVQASKASQKQYKAWLNAGVAKGMRPLFRSLAKAENVFTRPFQDVTVEERAKLRRQQWVKVWGEAGAEYKPGKVLEAKAKQNPLPPIEGTEIERIAKRVADKAGGLDGLTYASLRNLPSQAYQELACVLNASEESLTAPIQWQQQQVCMLAKKPTIERPIYLTSVTYRLWCFARRGPVQQWIQHTQNSTAWDKATPGNTCLQIAVNRLLKGEVSRCNKKHMIAILIDLETFYDCVDLQLLADRLCEAQFPPVVGALALQAYAGERHIVSEDVLSEGIRPKRGIPAGCPLAITMARVFLAPILREASTCEGLAGLDTWVDDIGADFEDKRPAVVARQALTGYRVLAEGLKGSGLKISGTKTGFLASTKEARKELQALLKPDEPKIFHSMRDLGVDCALGRLRRVTHQKARVGKGKKRQVKLAKLKVPVEACKVRLCKGSICASMLWGHQAQGLPPSRVRDLRRAVALQVGLQKLGDLEVALSAEADRVSDPWATVVMQQVQEWFTALSRWGADQAPLERVWQQTATGFSEGTANWHHVKGPLAATVGHMTGLGWLLPGVMEWHRPEPRTVYNLEVAADRARVLQAIEEDVCAERSKRIAAKTDCPTLANGLDWFVGRKVLRQLKAKGDMERLVGLRAVWHGSLICEHNSPIKVCPCCKEPATWAHILLHCQWWNQHGWQLPSWFQEGLRDGDAGFWTRGLRPFTPNPTNQQVIRTGIWETQDRIEASGLTFSTDASGGPYTKDPRLRKVGVSVIAFEWKHGQPEEVGRIVSTLPGKQTVFRGELYGILLLLQGTVGTADATVDCLGVVSRLAHCKGKAHADLWAAIKAEKHSRLKATWVASHLTPAQFVSRFGEDQAWRQVTNEVADEACSSFAGSLVDAGFATRMHELDTVHKKVLDVLSERAARILGAKKLAAHPCVKAYLELKEVQAAKKPTQAETVADQKASKTTPKKHRGSGTNVGHGHAQTYQEWFEQLTQGTTASNHKWKWSGPDLKCERCGFKLLHTRNRKVLQQREATPCGADGPGLFPNVHVSRHMQLQEQVWMCTQCGGLLSLHGEISKKLLNSCSFRKDSRSKVQGAQAVEVSKGVGQYFQKGRGVVEDQPALENSPPG